MLFNKRASILACSAVPFRDFLLRILTPANTGKGNDVISSAKEMDWFMNLFIEQCVFDGMSVEFHVQDAWLAVNRYDTSKQESDLTFKVNDHISNLR